MKKIIIKQIDLVNFKGIRKQTINFNEDVTSIFGKNATGKSTIFDAFTWLLFGKNSEDKKQFNIKTLDKDGNVIERLPHEVSAVLDVDGETITLRKQLNEKWQKKRGSATEEFTGNEELRFYNDVPVTMKEWNGFVDNICNENTFKVITNPLYFTSLKWDAQRAVLINMVGDVTNEEVLDVYPALSQLIADIEGKGIEMYKKEINAKKTRIKADIDGIPERIDERKLAQPKTTNWNLLTAQIHHKEQKLAEVQMLIDDASKAYKDKAEKMLQNQRKLSDLKMALMHEENAVKTAETSRRIELENKINELKAKINYIRNSEIKRLQDSVITRQEQLEELRQEWKSIKAGQLVMGDDMFICPTCKRPLDADDIEKKKAELTANFNADKARKLEYNVSRGKGIKGEIGRMNAEIGAFMYVIEELEKQLVTLTNQKTDIQPTTTNDKIEELKKQIADIEASMTDNADNQDEPDDNAELKNQTQTLKDELAELNKQLGMKELIEQNEKRITELEERLKTLNEELALLEGIEFNIETYEHTRIELLEKRINDKFSMVNWKLFINQINGGVVETCQAMVNGVPFADLNKAMQINAGLDIINTISDNKDISAPIFIDNAEAVNELFKTSSQMIRLVVSEDKELKIA